MSKVVQAGFQDLVDLSLDAGANVTFSDRLGRLPLHMATHAGDVLMVKKIYDLYPDAALVSRDWEGIT